MKSHPGVAAKTFEVLGELGIEPEVVSTSPIKIACHIAKADVERAVTGAARGPSSSIPKWRSAVMSSPLENARIGIVGATGAVGTLTLRLLSERGFKNVRAFASSRSAGKELPFGDGKLVVEEATPEALRAGDLDLCLFSVGTSRSEELVPHASAGGAICIDKSSAYRLVDGYPLVVPEVNGARALEALERDRIIANPNCCAIPLTTTLKPLHDAAGLKSVHVATYQSVSGAGAKRNGGAQGRKSRRAQPDHGLDLGGRGLRRGVEVAPGDAEDPRAARAARGNRPASACRCWSAHSEAIWIELEDDLSPEQAADVLRGAPSVRVLDLPEFPTPKDAAGGNEVLVDASAVTRPWRAASRLYLSCDNLRKGGRAERPADRRAGARGRAGRKPFPLVSTDSAATVLSLYARACSCAVFLVVLIGGAAPTSAAKVARAPLILLAAGDIGDCYSDGAKLTGRLIESRPGTSRRSETPPTRPDRRATSLAATTRPGDISRREPARQ